MEPAVAISTPTDEVLQTAAQFGIKNIVVYSGPGTPGRNKPRQDFSDYVALRMKIETFGLNLVAIEGGFSPSRKYDDVIFGGPKQDELIEDLLAEVRDMGNAGIPIWGYNWMPNSWGRAYPSTVRGGAMGTGYDWDWEQSRRPLTFGREIDEGSMWDALEYWIKALTPVAEEVGIRCGIHPEDPPVPQRAGVPGLFRNFAAFKRLIEIVPSDYNAIEFCQGTFSEMPGEDIYEMIEYFASRNKVLYVHFRNVSGKAPKFNEEYINTGYVDMKRAMRTYRDAGYKGTFIDDHCPIMLDDTPFPGNLGGYRSRLFAQGYIQGLIEAVEKEEAYGGPVETH
jgi:mannonate dehydratase